MVADSSEKNSRPSNTLRSSDYAIFLSLNKCLSKAAEYGPIRQYQCLENGS